MDGPRHCHIEWSKLNKHCILTHYVESRKMVQMNLFAKQKERCRRKEQTYGHKGAGGVGMHWETGIDIYTLLICSVQFSHSVVSDPLWPHGLQHARPPCPSPTPGAHSNSCPLNLWYHPTILCRPLLLSPIFPSIRVFSSESALCLRWPKYWSFSFNISPSNEHPGLISFRMDWLDLLAVQGTLKSLLQHHSSKASSLRCSAFFTVQLSHPYMTSGKTIALTRWTFVGKVMSLLSP